MSRTHLFLSHRMVISRITYYQRIVAEIFHWHWLDGFSIKDLSDDDRRTTPIYSYIDNEGVRGVYRTHHNFIQMYQLVRLIHHHVTTSYTLLQFVLWRCWWKSQGSFWYPDRRDQQVRSDVYRMTSYRNNSTWITGGRLAAHYCRENESLYWPYFNDVT